MDDELQGVKGWLAVFVLAVALLAPGWAAVRVWLGFHTGTALFLAGEPAFMTLRQLAWTLVLFLFLIGWITAWKLRFVHNWGSVRLAIAGLWLTSLAVPALGYLAATRLIGVPTDLLITALGPQELIKPLLAILGTVYLLKSERVANTYGGVQEESAAFE